MSRQGPAFQFYAAEALSDEGWISMSYEARGVFITLLCHQWIEGSIPADQQQIARLLCMDVRRFRRIWAEVCDKFELLRADLSRSLADFDEKSGRSQAEVGEKSSRLVNEKLAIMRATDAEYRERQAESGKKGNEVKKGLASTEADEEDPATRKRTGRKPTANPHGSRPQSARSSPSPSSSPSGVPPKAPQGAGDLPEPDPEPEPNPPDNPELRRVRVVFNRVGWTQPEYRIAGRCIGFVKAGGTKAAAGILVAASQGRDSPAGWLWTVIESEAGWRGVVSAAEDDAKIQKQRKAADENQTDLENGQADKPDADTEELLG